ncbi:hypothetical protein OEZ66_31175, partial [Escherichia coli]|nr:hypothetical protein [Escherichia coli]
PKTFNTEETESGCLPRSVLAIHHLIASVLEKSEPNFIINSRSWRRNASFAASLQFCDIPHQYQC